MDVEWAQQDSPTALGATPRQGRGYTSRSPRRSSFLPRGAQMQSSRPQGVYMKSEMKKNVFFILCLVEEKRVLLQ